jgi:hypothetical protein
MHTGHKPTGYASSLRKFQANPVNSEAIKSDAWRNEGILVVDINDDRLDFVDREFIERIGNRLFQK